MNDIENILKKELAGKINEYAVIPSEKIVFSTEVVNACKINYCGKYNTCWTCPPAVGDLRELEKKYKTFKYAFVFTTKSNLEDSFDLEGMDSARDKHIVIEKGAWEKLKGYKTESLTVGSCPLCEKCTYPDAPCRFPDIAKPSVEAVGIDVTQLAKTCNIRYYNGENTVTYFSVIFFG